MTTRNQCADAIGEADKLRSFWLSYEPRPDGLMAELNESMESMRVNRLNIIEQSAWKLIRRFIGPRCPLNAVDAITCVNLMDAEMVCVSNPDGTETFIIRRGCNVVDSEDVPDWRLR